MKIEQRLIRRHQEDVIEIGNILEKFYNGQAGAILRAIVNGRKSEEAKIHQTELATYHPTHAERVLGRIEAYQNIIDDIEQAIADKNRYTEPIEGGDEQ